ncbi:unnamed protein product [Lampetra planeri]
MEQTVLDSLALGRLLSLVQEMGVSLPATKEDDLTSLKVARCIEAHFNLQQWPGVAAYTGFSEDDDKPERQEPVQACALFVRSPRGKVQEMGVSLPATKEDDLTSLKCGLLGHISKGCRADPGSFSSPLPSPTLSTSTSPGPQDPSA